MGTEGPEGVSLRKAVGYFFYVSISALGQTSASAPIFIFSSKHFASDNSH